MRAVISFVVGYLLGAAPLADRAARRHGIADLRSLGDGNPGYWNLREQVGRRAARPVLVGDAAKGAAAAVVGLRLRSTSWAIGGAMVGHAFPPGRSGGKSVLAFVGGAAVASPRSFLAAVTTTGLARLAGVSFERSVAAGFVAYPAAQLRVDGWRATVTTGVLMTFIGTRFATTDAASTRPEG